MELQQHGVAAGSGMLGAIIGGVAAFFKLKQAVAVQDQKLADLTASISALKDLTEKSITEFKKATEESIKKIESAHEKHASLVVYKDKCATCEDLRDSKHEALSGKIDILLARIQ